MAANTARSATGVYRFGQQARKLFVDSILNRVTTTYSAELRQQATKKLFYGDSAPFFALIGVGMASGAGILTKEDELECVCYEINEAAGRIQQSWNSDDVSEKLDTNFNIDKLNIGPALAKGCAAVVYAATLKNLNESTSSMESTTSLNNRLNDTDSNDDGSNRGYMISSTPQRNNSISIQSHNSSRPEFLTPIHNMSRFVHNFGGSVDNLQLFNQSSITSMLEQQPSSSLVTDTSITNSESESTSQDHNNQVLPISIYIIQTVFSFFYLNQ